eukprot:248025-Rhodomonas_salina.1
MLTLHQENVGILPVDRLLILPWELTTETLHSLLDSWLAQLEASESMVILLHTDLVWVPQGMQVVDLILTLELAADSLHLHKEQDTGQTLCQVLDCMLHYFNNEHPDHDISKNWSNPLPTNKDRKLPPFSRKAALSEFQSLLAMTPAQMIPTRLNVHVLLPLMLVYFDSLLEYAVCYSDSDLIEKVELKEPGYPVYWSDSLAAVQSEGAQVAVSLCR